MIEQAKWKFIKASVRGTSHCLLNTACQDWSYVRLFDRPEADNDLLLLVASDGAGTASQAEQGARLVCLEFNDIVTKYIRDGGQVSSLTKLEADKWVKQISDVIAIHADECELRPRDFACTFIGAIIGSENAVFLQIGDGAIVIWRDNDYRTIFWPQAGEYANMTYFITDEAASESLQFSAVEYAIDEIAIFTDGLQKLALHYASRTVHTPFLSPMFIRLRSEPPGESNDLNHALTAYLDSIPVNERSDDDKTLILATRRPLEEVISSLSNVMDSSRVPGL